MESIVNDCNIHRMLIADIQQTLYNMATNSRFRAI